MTRDTYGYVQLEDKSIDEVPWHRRHIASHRILSAGVLAIVLSCSITAEGGLSSGKDLSGAENLMAQPFFKGGYGTHQVYRGAKTTVQSCGVARGLGSTIPASVRAAASHFVLPQHCATRCAVATLAHPGDAQAAAVDPFGRDVMEQTQQRVAGASSRKEGWGKKSGLKPKDYFAHVKTPADLAQPPPFSLQDVRDSVPKHLWKKNGWKSMSYLVRDIVQAVVLGVAATKAAALMPAWAAMMTVWPAYALLQGSVMWGLFVIGHDCGHQSFSNNKALNDFVGNIVHSSILVPYHQWRISHRKHHSSHGHVENDESWGPMTKTEYEKLSEMNTINRFGCPAPLFAYPFYLAKGTTDKPGSHYNPDNSRLFQPTEKKLVIESNTFNLGMVGVLAACTAKFGLLSMLKYYFAPWLVYVVLLDAVTYLHHHGHHDADHAMPWYRGDEWTYLRGGLTCLDRDYGILNNLHHDIGTHVIHHLFPQMPHYNLLEATQHLKKLLGPYYRQPEPCPGPAIGGGYANGGVSLGLPTHLIKPMFRSFKNDRYVKDDGDVLFYRAHPQPGNVTSLFA
eukprot:gnl/MRDRNA2_/MRDRNA2_102459_c0_seq1.p1 gnl/MRDRNA2_/MRDRNA2_102459_c0~~gnl/MRDRNA2_/MRDRNA2_102459_c0_seq1.p1  ORF type:complete len:565 (-),score=50.96 gnl/MRDRNA2_/MRDRNA2_102459_c0_seq1:697-2391(-)